VHLLISIKESQTHRKRGDQASQEGVSKKMIVMQLQLNFPKEDG
jgi:hypothetical protein